MHIYIGPAVPSHHAGASRLDAEGLVRFAQDLVRIPSVHDPLLGRDESGAASLVERKMRELGWQPALEEVAPGRPNVVAVVEGGLPGPTLLFEGHTDVVTEGDAASWSFDPFSGDIVAGRLLGRGSADMKGGVAAMIFAAAALERPFPGRVVVAALADEEGLMLGVKRFVASGQADGVDAAIVCEPEAGEVCLVQKGALRLHFEVQGRMAHGAMPEKGANPVPVLAELVAMVGEEQRRLQSRVGRHPLLGEVYLTPTVLHAGEAAQLNVIPAGGWLAVDVRTVPGIDHDELVSGLRARAEDVASRHGVVAAVEVVDDRPPTETPAASPIARAVAVAHERVTGEKAPFGGVPGTTDGTILHRDAGVPVVVYGPGGKWIAHQVDEHVEVAELVRCARVYLEAARSFLSCAGGRGIGAGDHLTTDDHAGGGA